MKSRARVLLLWIAALWGSLCAAGTAWGQSVEKGALGVGIALGEPTGVAAKLYLQDDTAIAGVLGFALVGGGIHAHADFQWHPWVLEDAEYFVLPAYIGVGGRILDEVRGGGSDVLHLGVRGVVGMLFDFKKVPLDVYAEIAPIIDFPIGDDDSTVELDVNAGLGARYYF